MSQPPSNPGSQSARPYEDAFARALRLDGSAYLAAEAELRSGGDQATALLRAEQAAAPTALTRFVAATIADWMAAKPDEFADAMAALRKLEESRRGKASPTPREDVVEQLLVEKFGARIAAPLALRLLKERWPPWKVQGSLLYLGRVRVSATAPALARYAVTASVPQVRARAVDALAAVAGTDAVTALLEEARAWSPDLSSPERR